MLFDSTRELGIALPSEEGTKRVSVSFPSDTDFCEWRRKKKIIQKDLGRRSYQIVPPEPEKIDLDLVTKILVKREDEVAPELDEADANYIINRLSQCEVSEQPEREGSAYVIKLKVLGQFRTVHVLRLPNMREWTSFDKLRSSIKFLPYGTQEIRMNYQVAGELYDKLKQRVDGYVGDRVPVSHKYEAVNVLLQEFRAQQEEAPADEDDELG
jgi:hypothetical protein